LSYGGDFLPVKGVPVSNGSRFKGVVWTGHMEDARKALATKDPHLAEELNNANWTNYATYQCKEAYFDHFYIPAEASAAPRN
jgi:hypothetical protein